MKLKYLWRKGTHDCLICALKPIIALGFSLTFIVRAKCPHSENVKVPSFQQDNCITACSVLHNSFILIGITLAIITLRESEDLSLKFIYEQTILTVKFINTATFTLSFYAYSQTYLTFANGLVTIIERRKLFGIDSILSRTFTRNIRLLSSAYLIICITYLLVFLHESMKNDTSTQNIFRSFGIICMYINTVNIFCYIISTVLVYNITLQNCYNTIQDTLNRANYQTDGNFVEVRLQERIQYLQRFYLAVCQNYKNHIFAFGNTWYYIGQFIFTVLLGVHFYLKYYYVEKDVWKNFWSLKESAFIDSFFVSFGILTYCIFAYKVTHGSEDVLSFLYRYPITKLNKGESAQVELLIITLTSQKPELTAGDLFVIGINLLSSLSGTVVTYILVALQFHTSLMAYNSNNP